MSRSTTKKSRSSSSKVCYTELNQSRRRRRKHHLKSEFALFQTSWVKRANKKVQISVLQHCYKTSWIALSHVLPATNSFCRLWIVAAERIDREYRIVLLFTTKSVHAACLSDPNLFNSKWQRNSRVLHDSRVILSHWSEVSNQICCKTGLIWVIKPPTSFFNFFCSNFAKHVARLCQCPFHCSLISSLSIRQMFANFFWSWILKDCVLVQEKKKKTVVLCSRRP